MAYPNCISMQQLKKKNALYLPQIQYLLIGKSNVHMYLKPEPQKDVAASCADLHIIPQKQNGKSAVLKYEQKLL